MFLCTLSTKGAGKLSPCMDSQAFDEPEARREIIGGW